MRTMISLACCLLLYSPLAAQSGGGLGEGGGGGGTGTPLTVVITTDAPADGNVVIGKTHSFSFTATGGVEPYSAVWAVQCPPVEGGPVGGIPESPLVHCFNKEGIYAVKVFVTDSTGKAGQQSKTITVSGPDDLVPDFTDESNPSNGPGSLLCMDHTFTAKVGQVIVGPCWQDACVYEFAAYTVDTNGDGQPDGWDSDPPSNVEEWDAHARGLRSCPADLRPAFFWNNPFIFDKKTFTDPGINWPELPVYGTAGATPFYAYKQWVAIKVPVCRGTEPFRYLVKGPFTVYRYHAGGGKIIDVIQPQN